MSSPLERIMAARDKGRIATVALSVDGPMLGLYTLFGRGVAVDVEAECTLRALVCEHLGVSDDYLATGIQTVFLDGWAVDDVDAAVVVPGAVVALSAAMPGLVGATMRRGGHYAVLRENITLAGAGDSAPPKASGAVLVKLFNQVARDLGMPFLRRGGWVEGDRFADFVAAQPPERIASAFVDHRPADAAAIAAADWTRRAVALSVAPE